MDTLLASLLVLVVGCLGALIGAFFWLRHRLREKVAYHRAAGIHRFPQRLRLKQIDPFTWRKLSRGPQRVAAFQTLGFEPLGGFRVDEIPGARLFVSQHPVSGLVGLVNEHEQLGTWSDVLLFARGENQPILASNILRHCHFFLLPGHPKIHKHRATEEELVEAVKTAAGTDATAFKMTAAEFGPLYEEAFAASVDQRLLEPLTDAELRRLLREQNSPCCDSLTDAEFARIKSQYPAVVSNELRLICAAQFLRETDMPASQWQDARGRILVVHDRTPIRELAGRRVFGVHLTESIRRCLRRQRGLDHPRDSFAQLNATLAPAERYKKLGEVIRPVPADIYSAPRPSSRKR